MTVYGLFYFFDRKTSDPAKRAINGWISYTDYEVANLRAAFVTAFDAVYSHPLLRLRAILRSIMWSILILFIVDAVVHGTRAAVFTLSVITLILIHGAALFKFTVAPFIGNLVSDYISIFFVRFFLQRLPQNKPLLVIIFSAAAGCIMVSVIFIFLNMIAFVGELVVTFREPKLWLMPLLDMRETVYLGTMLFKSGAFQGFGLTCFVAGLVVHSWLLLFASGVVVLRLLQRAARTARSARWFLRRGSEHPLEAIGLVAAVITFASTVLYKFVTG